MVHPFSFFYSMFNKNIKKPLLWANPSGFNKRYGEWSYESKLSPPHPPYLLLVQQAALCPQ